MQSDKNVAALSGYYSATDLGVPISRLQTLERQGKLKSMQFGVRYYWRKEDVERLRSELEGPASDVPAGYEPISQIVSRAGVCEATVARWCQHKQVAAVKARGPGQRVHACWFANPVEVVAYARTRRPGSHAAQPEGVTIHKPTTPEGFELNVIRANLVAVAADVDKIRAKLESGEPSQALHDQVNRLFIALSDRLAEQLERCDKSVASLKRHAENWAAVTMSVAGLENKLEPLLKALGDPSRGAALKRTEEKLDRLLAALGEKQ